MRAPTVTEVRPGILRVKTVVALMAVVAGCSGSGNGAGSGPGGGGAAATVAATAPTVAARFSPLTGLPLPAGSDLDGNRPALAVKIDNHPDAQPQPGLEAADLVFEERVEGITRLLAVFWSRDVTEVGPIRSARTSDIDLLASLGRPLLAWSGGNDGVVAAVAESDAVDVGVDRLPVLYRRAPGRFAPHDLMSDTGALREAARDDASAVQAPLAVGDGGPVPAGARRIQGVSVDLEGVVATWAWDPAGGRWLRFQQGRPHLAASGDQLGAANVVVLEVRYTTSAADADSPEAVTVGKGSALLLSADGTAADLTWQRADGRDPFTLFDAAGAEVVLRPGNSWIELPRQGQTSLLAPEEAAAILATR